MFSGHIVTPMALDGYMLILHHNSTAGARIDSSREINQEVFSSGQRDTTAKRVFFISL